MTVTSLGSAKTLSWLLFNAITQRWGGQRCRPAVFVFGRILNRCHVSQFAACGLATLDARAVRVPGIMSCFSFRRPCYQVRRATSPALSRRDTCVSSEAAAAPHLQIRSLTYFTVACAWLSAKIDLRKTTCRQRYRHHTSAWLRL